MLQKRNAVSAHALINFPCRSDIFMFSNKLDKYNEAINYTEMGHFFT